MSICASEQLSLIHRVFSCPMKIYMSWMLQKKLFCTSATSLERRKRITVFSGWWNLVFILFQCRMKHRKRISHVRARFFHFHTIRHLCLLLFNRNPENEGVCGMYSTPNVLTYLLMFICAATVKITNNRISSIHHRVSKLHLLRRQIVTFLICLHENSLGDTFSEETRCYLGE